MINPAAPCLLFVPANRPDRFAKALASGADFVCIDLEDSVPQADKGAARRQVIESLPELPRERVLVRVNGIRTEAGLRDLIALKDACAMPRALLVPMVESVGELAPLHALDVPAIIPLIETCEGLAAAAGIARAPAVAAMMLGGADLAAEIGVALEWSPLAVARAQFVLACARARIPAIDVPFVHIADPEGLASEAAQARALGFAAKAAIHPSQVSIIRDVFRPTPGEIAQAQAALEAFSEAGGQAVAFRGSMLEAPIMDRLKRVASYTESGNG